MSSLTKAQSERIHSKRRALERAGVWYSRKDLDAIVTLIKSGASLSAKRQSNNRAIHVIEYKGLQHTVVYNKQTKQIITFLDGLVFNAS